jgi:replicative DNA helicase
MSDRRPLPHNEDMEKGLISCLIRSPEARKECPRLPDGAWYLPHHREIYEAILATPSEPDQEVDYWMVKDHLKRRNRFEAVGGDQELTIFWQFVPDGRYWKHYQSHVLDYYSRREMIQRCWQIEAKMYDLSIGFADEVPARGYQISI